MNNKSVVYITLKRKSYDFFFLALISINDMNFHICILRHVRIKKLKFTLVENFLLYRVQYLDFIFFQIKFVQSAQDLHNFIRGCDKVPGAWTTINGQVIYYYL